MQPFFHVPEFLFPYPLKFLVHVTVVVTKVI
jgi:hypothetical protein